MRIKNAFSFLRFLTVILFILMLVSCSVGFTQGNTTLVTIGVFCVVFLVIIRIIRFMYRD
jgi:hypothetical protein